MLKQYIEFMFVDIKINVWGSAQTQFSLSCQVRVKMSSEKSPEHMHAQEQKLCYFTIIIIIFHFGGK